MVEAPEIQTSKTSSALKLTEKIKEQDATLEPFRNREREFVQKFCGRYYGKLGGTPEPLQMLNSLISILQPALAINPQTLVTTEDTDLTLFARVFRAALNKTLEEIKFSRTMRRVVLDSMFMQGTTKTGICDRFSRHYDDEGNYLADPGMVFVERVKFANWIGDMTADTEEEMAFQGDRYMIRLKRALGLFVKHKDVIEHLNTVQIVPEGRTDELTTGKRSLDDYYDEQVQLCDIWLPGEHVIVTVAGDPDAQGQHYLGEREYRGPEAGPYDYFKLGDVPSNFMQVPLLAVVRDLHDLMNSVARKIQRQAERQKDIAVVPLGKPQDTDAIRDAIDGEIVQVSDPSLVKQLSFGGANDANYQVVAWLHDYFNRIAGNPELLGGLGPQANTLGQDEQNRSAAGGRTAYYRERLMESAGDVLRKVAFFRWTDPIWSRSMVISTTTGVDVPVRWTPDLREGEFLDYNFDIDPYSKQSSDPRAQYQDLLGFVQNLVVPMMQIGAAQGQLVQTQEIIAVGGELLGIRQAARMFRRGAPMQMSGAGAGAPAGGPAPDNRIVRRMPAKPQPIESEAEQMGVEV